MSADEKQNPTAMTMLMSIRYFDRNVNLHKNETERVTNEMVSTYEKGISMLENAGKENLKQCKEQLNEVRVDANQLNQVITLAWERRNAREGFDFEQHWKDFESRFNDLKNSALKFESMGAEGLSETEKARWNAEIRIFENKTEPEVKRNEKLLKPVFQFIYRHTPENLVKINEIVNRYVPENSSESDPKELESLYRKALAEFQREFKPQNLWDSFLELLAGGVHPSPSERVMFEKWIDGEQKTREDM